MFLKTDKKYRLLMLTTMLTTSYVMAQTRHIEIEATGRHQYNLNKRGLSTGEYSGITKAGNDTYFLVSDKGKIAKIRMTYDGKMNMELIWEKECDKGRDMEGVAYNAKTNTLFISGEGDQQILEYTLDGEQTGRKLEVPDMFGLTNITSNGGFESLTYNEHTGMFWTTTEMPLKTDKDNKSQILRLQSFNDDMKPQSQFLYELDQDEDHGKMRTYVHGVADMLALNDGRLIVMERSVAIKKKYVGSYCDVKLYLVNPIGKIAGTKVEKELLHEFRNRLSMQQMFGGQKFANYEGMCIGPVLDDGCETILLVSDSQSGAGNSLYRMKDYLKILKIKY